MAKHPHITFVIHKLRADEFVIKVVPHELGMCIPALSQVGLWGYLI